MATVLFTCINFVQHLTSSCFQVEFHRADEPVASEETHSSVVRVSSDESTSAYSDSTSGSSKFGSETGRKISDAINNNHDLPVVKERIARR